jgi:hypothetical protein
MLSSIRSRRRFILASVKFLSRALTALNSIRRKKSSYEWAVVSQYHRAAKRAELNRSPQRGKVGTSTRVAGAWIADFLEEAEPWPAGKTKDQIGCGLESRPF